MRIRGAVLERLEQERPYSRSRPIVVDDLDLAGPGDGELLVRITSAGLCHSDLSVIDGVRPRPLPMLLGHEAAGIVEGTGAGVDDIAVGDQVVLTFLPRCGRCAACVGGRGTPCIPGTAANVAGTLMNGGRRLERRGEPIHHHLGISGFATHAVVNRSSVVPIPADIPSEVAALLGCAVLTGGGAVVNVARPVSGDVVAVVGLGGVGMAAALTALAFDDVRVVAVDLSPDKLAAARALGVDEALTPDAAIANGLQAAAVIEAAGSERAFETAIAITEPGGSTIAVGIPHPDARASVSPNALVTQSRSVIGSYMGSAVPARDIPIFIDLWRSGRLDVAALISDTIDLEDINEGMDRIADGLAIRQLIRMPGD